jgi:hypothetical protein
MIIQLSVVCLLHDHLTLFGAPDEIRTHTRRILSPLPLPVGLQAQIFNLCAYYTSFLPDVKPFLKSF